MFGDGPAHVRSTSPRNKTGARKIPRLPGGFPPTYNVTRGGPAPCLAFAGGSEVGAPMANDRSRPRIIPILIGLGAAIIGVDAATGARADRIKLRGGGQVRGKLLPDPQDPDRRTILTETGKTPLSFQKAQILEVQPEPGPLDEYLQQRDAAESTAA